MGVHGSTGAGAGTGMPSLHAAARLAAMSSCPPPAAAPATSDPTDRQRQHPTHLHHGTQHRGAAHAAHQHSHGAHPHGTRHQHVAGGGPAAAPTRPPVDPAMAALASLYGDSAPAEVQPSAARLLAAQLTAQLALLLGETMSRLRLLLPSGADATTHDAAAASTNPAARGDAAANVVPLQPPPPPPLGPTLTLDPELGTIVDAGIEPVPDGPRDSGVEVGLPTSWVPITGRLLGSTRDGLGTLVDRIDALLDELGLTRLQLLALTVAAPLAVAFLIEVVASILDGR